MAESYDRKTSLSITDDMIKEALKSGLSSIKASDNLINLTLEKCQTEITENKQEKKSRSFMNMAYKLGAPLAAGALILVLIISGTELFSGKMSTNMAAAPQASAAPAAPAAAPPGEAGSKDKNTDDCSVSYDSASAESIPENPELKGKGLETLEEKSDGDVTMMRFGENITVLNSLANRTANNAEPGVDESVIHFTSITDQYNLKNGTGFSLAKDSITRIYTLPESGIDAETLLDAGDYNEILSGEGYWALPLKNQNGSIDIVLTAATFDINSPETPVSSRNTVYSAEGKNFTVSSLENSSYLVRELGEIFDSDRLSAIISEMGYEYDNKAEIIIADINYGTDFVALTETKNEKLVIPLFTNQTLFGVVNKKIYTWPEFVKIISTGIGQ